MAQNARAYLAQKKLIPTDVGDVLTKVIGASVIDNPYAPGNAKQFNIGGQQVTWGGGKLYDASGKLMGSVPENTDNVALARSMLTTMGYKGELFGVTPMEEANKAYELGFRGSTGFEKDTKFAGYQAPGAGPTGPAASGKSYVNAAGETVTPQTAQEEQKMINLKFKQPGQQQAAGAGQAPAPAGDPGADQQPLTGLQKKVMDTQGGLSANKEFVNAVFKAFHNRDANQNELNKFTGQTVDQIRNDIIKGAQTAGLPTVNESFIAQYLPTEPVNLAGEALAGEEKPAVEEFFTDLIPSAADMTGQAINLADMSLSGINQIILDWQQKQQEAAETKRIAAETEQATLLGDYKELVTGDSRLKEAKDLLEDLEMTKKQEALTGIMADIAKEKEVMQLGVSQEGQRIAPMSIIGRRQRVVEERGLARIGALTAMAEVAQNDIDMAWQKAEFFMDAINADKDNQIRAYEKLLDLSESRIVTLKQDEKDYINNQIATIRDERDRLETNKNNIMNLIIENPLAAQKGKVSLTDTPEQAVAKMAPFLAEEAETADVKAYSLDMMTKYPDAGITMTDTPEQIGAKLSGSKIYQDQIRGPVGGTTPVGAYKFSSSDTSKLLAAGLTSAEIKNIQSDLSTYGIEQTAAGLSESQGSTLRSILSGDAGIDDTTVGLLITAAIDKEGNLDISGIPAAQRVEVISRAVELGYIGEEGEEEETKGWLKKILSAPGKLLTGQF